MSKSAGNLKFDKKLIDVRTRSVEKALEPLIIQVCHFLPLNHILNDNNSLGIHPRTCPLQLQQLIKITLITSRRFS